MSSSVVTRIAPSPTGFMHIGTARTALFNWLYARHCGGAFRLRIEDTDKARSTPDAIEAILDGMRWLGLDWDGEVIYQSARAEDHRAAALRLLAEGKAYQCYASAEELDAMRAEARAAGKPVRYDGRWRDRDPSDAPDGVAPVIRFKAPRDGLTVIQDAVQGTVEISNDTLDDLVLLRSDGSPTYMLAVVVDDHDMGVTHVIRGDDHLINAARQCHIVQALGWPVPSYAHVPLIHGQDGAKLSKRHGALGVEAYRDMGYLAEALRNYLARLGWSHGDDEIFTSEQAVSWFDLTGLNKAPARLDLEKLNFVNAHYLRSVPSDVLFERLRTDFDAAAGGTMDAAKAERLKTLMPALAERAKTLPDLVAGAGFVLAERPIPIETASAKHLTDDSRAMLKSLAASLEGIADWTMDTVEEAVRGFAADQELKFGKVAQPLRAALTGTPNSPGLFDVVFALGREETLARIRDQVEPS